jgi:hypothetical protein
LTKNAFSFLAKAIFYFPNLILQDVNPKILSNCTKLQVR